MLMIPMVGRAVHFYSPYVKADGKPHDSSSAGRGYNGQGAGPYHAVITQVFSDAEGNPTFCNLAVTPPFGEIFHVGSVVQKGAPLYHAEGSYWEWPPRI